MLAQGKRSAALGKLQDESKPRRGDRTRKPVPYEASEYLLIPHNEGPICQSGGRYRARQISRLQIIGPFTCTIERVETNGNQSQIPGRIER